MDIEKELQEIEQLCGCTITQDIITGWNSAKGCLFTPPHNFSRERSRGWVKGNKAYQSRVISIPDTLTKQETYRAGFHSHSQNNGKLINPFKGKGEIEHAFTDGWAQALRRQPTTKFENRSTEKTRPSSLRKKYTPRDNADVYEEPEINCYKLLKDGE